MTETPRQDFPLASGWRRRIPAARFIGGFGLLLGGFYALALVPWCDAAYYRYLVVNAWISGLVLRCVGQDVRVSEVTIRAADFAISVRRGCDAVEPAWFFCAAVLAFPAPWRRKWSVLPGGIALIVMLNLVRIVSLFFIGRRMPGFFPTAHLELWPAVFLVAALALWASWIRSVLGKAPEHVRGQP